MRSPNTTQGQIEKQAAGWFGGCNSTRNPWILDDSQYPHGINIVNRGGVTQTRPGRLLGLTLPPGNLQGGQVITINKLDVNGNVFQGGAQFLVFAVSGIVYAIPFPLVQPNPLSDWNTYRLSNLQFNAEAKRIYFCVAQKSLSTVGSNIQLETTYNVIMMQDGIGPAAYWDGDQNLHLNEDAPEYQTPSGTWMAFSGGRLWLARDNSLLAGDLLDPLSFRERVQGSGQGDFNLPDAITGLVNTIGTTFQATLIAFTQDQTFSFLSYISDREQWSTTANFQTTLYPALGCVSGLSIVNHAGLLWWYAKGGLVNFNSATAAYLTSRVKYQDNEMVQWTSSMYEDKSGICACSFSSYLSVAIPYQDVFNSVTMVMDYSVADELNSIAPPAWQGVWTGIRPVNFITTLLESTGEFVCMALSVDYELLNGSHNHVWFEFQDERTDSFDYLDASSAVLTAHNQIYCSMETKLLGDGLDLKIFKFLLINLMEIDGQVNFKISYRGTRGSYKELFKKQIIAITQSWQTNDPEILKRLEDGEIFVPQTRRLLSPVAKPDTQEQDKEVEFPMSQSVDRCFSLYAQWCGHAAIESVMIVMEPQPETPSGKSEYDEETLNVVDQFGESHAYNQGKLTSTTTIAPASNSFNFSNNAFNRPFTPRFPAVYYSSIPSSKQPDTGEDCVTCLPCSRDSFPPVTFDPTTNDEGPGLGPVQYFANQAQSFTAICPNVSPAHSLTETVSSGLFFASSISDANALALKYVTQLATNNIVCMSDASYTQPTGPISISVPATNATFWTSSDLPSGLTINSTNGNVTGDIETPGTYVFHVQASNSLDQNQATITLTLVSSLQPPVVHSDTITVPASTPVNYQISATNSPTSYGATNLPVGLTLNTSTGAITGTIIDTSIATYTVGISATNAAGTGNGTLTINVTSSSLSGLRWLLPNLGNTDDPSVCLCPDTSDQQLTVPSNFPNTSITVRIRGIVELKAYDGGTVIAGGNVNQDGTPVDDGNNVYLLSTSSPAHDYYLNPGAFTHDTSILDFTFTIPINPGCVIDLNANSIDGAEVKNGGGDPPTQSVPDDDPSNPITVTQPYNGQFVQMDVIG